MSSTTGSGSYSTWIKASARVGGRLIDRRDRRHHVAGVTHLVGAERRLVLDDDAVSVLPLDVPRGHDGGNARQRLRRRRVDRDDPRMRNSGAQDARDQHVRTAMVGEISEPPGYLIFDVGTNAPAIGDRLARDFDDRCGLRAPPAAGVAVSAARDRLVRSRARRRGP